MLMGDTLENSSRSQRATACILLLLAALSLLTTSACERIGGKTIQVEFRSAEGIGKDQPVYFAGVRIGWTGEPSIIEGRAMVPAYLARRHRDALPIGCVFVITEDPNKPGERALVGHDVGSIQRQMKDGTEVYPGVGNEVELALMIGAQKAKDFWKVFEQ